MKKRITSIVIAVAMLLTTVGVITTAPASAASTPYMTIGNVRYEVNSAGYKIREKVGQYYIWVESTYDQNGEITGSKLKCTKSLKKTPKVLFSTKSTKTGSVAILNSLVTNGSTIYFVVYSDNLDNGETTDTIYQTTVKSKKPKKIKTITKASVDNLAGYYNGRIYYEAGYAGPSLRSYHIKKHSDRIEKKNMGPFSGYGNYITMQDYLHDNVYLYNAKTKKTTKLKKAFNVQVYKKSLYLFFTNKQWDTWTVKKKRSVGQTDEEDKNR